MFIIMHCMGMPFNGATIESESLGGSESAAYYVAKELAAQGHQVTLFTTHPEEGEWDGVRYLWTGEQTPDKPLGQNFHFYASATPSDVMIIQRHPQAFAWKWASKVNLWWVHDLALYRQKDVVLAQMWNVDGVLTVSQYHKDQVCDVYNLDPAVVHVINNGVDLSLFEGVPGHTVADRHQLLYSSRPERGLENLVKDGGIMDELGDEYELRVCAYDNVTPQMEQYYAHITAQCNARDNVTILGSLTKDELAFEMVHSDLLVYPTTFEEVSCITAMEAMAAGLPMLSSAHAALPETCGGGAKLLPLTDGDEVDNGHFVKWVKKLCLKPKANQDMVKQQLARAKLFTWDFVAEAVTTVIAQCFDVTPFQKYCHLMHNSDEYAAQDLALNSERNPLVQHKFANDQQCYKFAADNTFAEHYKEYYDYEKERGAEYGPESLENNGRYLYVADLVGMLDPGGLVLDYGCAHGHYTINLAKRYPDRRFVGIDITPTNIDTAKQWAKDEGVENVEFHCGAVDSTGTLNWPDEIEAPSLVIAAEVLEHVADPQAIVSALHGISKVGATFVITTPYGPWEAEGYAEHYPWRAHLWHFERADLHDLWGDQDEFNVTVIPNGHSKEEEMMGSYVTTFSWPGGEGYAQGVVDMERKLALTPGRPTLSLCMIAKDEESNIRRCIESVIDIVDEVIIYIDEKTTDNTHGVLADMKRENPMVRFAVTHSDSPTDIGFDEARNRSIANANGDWILWLDADEVMTEALAIRKYLRNSQYAGYAIKQHHYSVNPPSLIKTDLPVRLFRNHIGVKFYGRVHEHPEVVMNEGVGRAIPIRDADIAHFGYSTEPVRRKRFARNYSLMVRDREDHPDRILGKFLWIRDIAQGIQYELERGTPVNSAMMDKAREGIELWRELLDDNTRMAVDALDYYSNLVLILGDAGAVDYEFSMQAKPIAAGRLNGAIAPKYKGTFLNRDHVKALYGRVENDMLEHSDSRYL